MKKAMSSVMRRSIRDNTLSEAQAKEIIGDSYWVDDIFNSLPKDKKGKVNKGALLDAYTDQAAEAEDETKQGLQGESKLEGKEQEYAVSDDDSDSDAGSISPLRTSPEPELEAKEFPAPKFTETIKKSRPGGTFIGGDDTAKLLEDIGGSERILRMTTRFYQKMFRDQHTDKFIKSHEDPHSDRLGMWVVEKMSGEGTPWSDSRPSNGRSQAHRDAWTSPKRETKNHGKRFKLDDCRVWMRLMFWSAREEGLDDHEGFFNWYVSFIGHFIAVYEFTASAYAKESANWSADQKNIDKYIEDDRIMKDVIGVGVY